MRKLSILLIIAICASSCLRDFEDTSFVPEELVMSWSETSKTVTKDATSFEVTLHSNLPWMIKPSVSWLSVTPDRGTGDAVLTVKVAKNRTVEDRSGYLRAIVTADQYSDFPVTQGKNDSSGGSITYFVKADGDPEASGLSWTNATSLTNAFDMAGDGDVILVAAGLYSPQTFLEGTDETDPSDKTFQ
ncbi:MAG: BACON domain-containing protein, partial [Bacteroidales bacterium]|nr:BACON domain-containing protein [Bacteroidales bacterium]